MWVCAVGASAVILRLVRSANSGLNTNKWCAVGVSEVKKVCFGGVTHFKQQYRFEITYSLKPEKNCPTGEKNGFVKATTVAEKKRDKSH